MGCLVAACAQPAPLPPPVVGNVLLFAVDDITVPMGSGQPRMMGSDLDGDGAIDNALGAATEALAGQMDTIDDAAVRALIASGAVASQIAVTVETGSDGDADGVVGLQYFASADATPGQLRGTATTSTSTAGAGFATDGLERGATALILPVLLDANPTPVFLAYTAIQMTPDAAGTGFDVRLQGLADAKAFATAACDGLLQMYNADPSAHTSFVNIFGGDHDTGVISFSECVTSQLMQIFSAPDVSGPDGAPYLSVGITLHVVPAPAT